MTPSQKLAKSIQNEDTERGNPASKGKSRESRELKQSYYVPMKNNDLIGRKYRETYGASLISREKSQERSRRRSLKKGLEGEKSEKFRMNNTIEVYNRSGRGRRLVADKSIEHQLATLESKKVGGRPYVNRRMLHY